MTGKDTSSDKPVGEGEGASGTHRTDVNTLESQLRDTLPVGTKVGPYEILAVLGAGGFGKVYLSRDPILDKQIAIKEFFPESHTRRIEEKVVPLSGSDESFRIGKKQFQREAQTIAAFKHHSIVEIYNILDANNTHYMVMEYLGQRTLTRFCEENGGQLDESGALAILIPLLDALDLVHASGKIHRDISPDNIMIRPDGVPVLLDFGNVRDALLEDDQAKRSRKVSKSTAVINDGFSPIELYSSSKTNLKPATDIYSLAAVFYLVITGLRPASSAARFEEEIENGGVLQPDGPLKPFSAVVLKGKFSKSLLTSFEGALALRARDRPQSIKEWREELFRPGQVNEKGSKRRASKPILIAASLALLATGTGTWVLLGNGSQPTQPANTGDAESVIGPDGSSNPTINTNPAISTALENLASAARLDLERAVAIAQDAVESGRNEPTANSAIGIARNVIERTTQVGQLVDQGVKKRDFALVNSARQEAAELIGRAQKAEADVQVAIDGVQQERDASNSRVASITQQAIATANQTLQTVVSTLEDAVGLSGVEDALRRNARAEEQAQLALEDANAAKAAADVVAAERARIAAQAALVLAQQAKTEVFGLRRGVEAAETAELARLVDETNALIARMELLADQARQSAAGLENVQSELDQVAQALQQGRNAQSRVGSAQATRQLKIAQSARDDVEVALNVITRTVEAIESLGDGVRAAETTALERVVRSTNEVLLELRRKSTDALANGQDVSGIDEPLARLLQARLTADEIEQSLAVAQQAADRPEVEQLLRRANEETQAVDVAINTIIRIREGGRAALAQLQQQSLDVLTQAEALLLATQERFTATNENAPAFDRAKAALKIIRDSATNVQAAVNQSNRDEAESGLEAMRRARQGLEVAIADLENIQSENIVQVRAAFAAATNALQEIEQNLRTAQEQSAGLQNTQPFLQAIQASFVQAQDAVKLANVAAENTDLVGVIVQRDIVLNLRTNVQSALLEIQKLVDEVETAETAELARLVDETNALIARMELLADQARQSAAGLENVQSELDQVAQALQQGRNAQSRVGSAQATRQLKIAQSARDDVEVALNVITRTVEAIESLGDGVRAAETTALERVVRSTNEVLLELRRKSTDALANGQDVSGIDEPLARLLQARLTADEIEQSLAVAQQAADRPEVEQLLRRANEETQAVDVAINTIIRIREGGRAALAQLQQQSLDVLTQAEALLLATQERFTATNENAPAFDRAKAALKIIRDSATNVQAAVNQSNRDEAESGLEAMRRARQGLEVAIADLENIQSENIVQVRAAFAAATNALQEIEQNLRTAQEQSAGLQNTQPFLQAIQASFVQAQDAVKLANVAAENTDLVGVIVQRDIVLNLRTNVQSALLEIQKLVDEENFRANAVITLAELNASERTDLYRGLLELGFLQDQEITETFLTKGASDPKIRQAVLGFNSQSGRPGQENLTPSHLSQIAGASQGVTDWEVERTIPLMRTIPERTLWDYGINRRLGQRAFTALPSLSIGSLNKARELISTFQNSIGESATGFFANETQLLRALDRPIDLNIVSTEGVAFKDWHYGENAQSCYIWSYAKRIEGTYLRPDAPVAVLSKQKGEETPDISFSIGPSNAFSSSRIRVTSDAGTTALVAVDGANLVLPPEGGVADKTAVSMLVKDRTIILSGKSIFNSDLKIVYSALGFSKAFNQIEQNCTLEVGFWAE